MHLRARPTFSVATSSASSRSRTCFFIPVSDMPKGSASSLIVAVPAPSRSRTARRVGSARAAKARSTVVWILNHWVQYHMPSTGRQVPANEERRSHVHRSLHERGDPLLVGGSQLLQREGGRPHGAFVEVRLVAEAERRVPRLELLRALEEADDLAVLGIRGHPVPGLRREGRRAGFDDRMEPLGHGAIRLRHLGDLREHVAFPIRLALRAPRRASAFSSWARSLIAARSSSVNPLDFLLPAKAKHLRASSESQPPDLGCDRRLAPRDSWIRVRLPAGSRAILQRSQAL